MFRVMIIEDNPNFRRTLRKALELEFPSITITEATNWVEALKEIASVPPHLIFVDIRLPTISGLELTMKIKNDHPEIIIIILTGHDMPEYRVAATRYKADYFFSKDEITTEKIVTLVKSVILKKG